MREAQFWDLITSFHYILIFCFLTVLIASIWFFKFAKGRTSLRVLAVVLFICLLFFGLIGRAAFFPGGGLYDTYYDSDRVAIFIIQESLDKYKKVCKVFPTTEQGLKALTDIVTNPDCPSFKPKITYLPKFQYSSDGERYAIEGNGDYGIRGLFVRGTEKEKAVLYIRE
jgi:hypothetical protein